MWVLAHFEFKIHKDFPTISSAYVPNCSNISNMCVIQEKNRNILVWRYYHLLAQDCQIRDIHKDFLTT